MQCSYIQICSSSSSSCNTTPSSCPNGGGETRSDANLPPGQPSGISSTFSSTTSAPFLMLDQPTLANADTAPDADTDDYLRKEAFVLGQCGRSDEQITLLNNSLHSPLLFRGIFYMFPEC
eukprot:Tbor_TRINITY_DN6379_c0_g1::TRINITY_DN6379_c0_g1_i1::g.17812::m.17812